MKMKAPLFIVIDQAQVTAEDVKFFSSRSGTEPRLILREVVNFCKSEQIFDGIILSREQIFSLAHDGIQQRANDIKHSFSFSTLKAPKHSDKEVVAMIPQTGRQNLSKDPSPPSIRDIRVDRNALHKLLQNKETRTQQHSGKGAASSKSIVASSKSLGPDAVPCIVLHEI